VTRTGNSYLTGSDSFLTARTFFKARGVYLNDGDVPEVDFNGKLFGLGPVFALPNVSSDAGRSGATMAEREDRSSAMGHAHTLSGHSQGSGMSSLGAVIGLSQTPAMSSAIPTAHAQYPPMGANGAYMRPPGLGAR
jgi:CCR4-NOT transcription complex subunit 7/8